MASLDFSEVLILLLLCGFIGLAIHQFRYSHRHH
jgi:hypothetical protein